MEVLRNMFGEKIPEATDILIPNGGLTGFTRALFQIGLYFVPQPLSMS